MRACPICKVTFVMPKGHVPGCANSGKDISEIGLPAENQTRINSYGAGLTPRTEYRDQLRIPESHQKVRLAIILEADKAHEEYAQYKGHWNNWMLGRAKSKLTSKAGVAALPGDFVLVEPRATVITGSGNLDWHCTIYSVRAGWNCAFSVSEVELL